jgi:hypothetical protein
MIAKFNIHIYIFQTGVHYHLKFISDSCYKFYLEPLSRSIVPGSGRLLVPALALAQRATTGSLAISVLSERLQSKRV